MIILKGVYLYTLLTSINEIGDFLSNLQSTELICLDTEATSLDIFNARWILLQIKLNDSIFLFDVEKLGKDKMNYIVDLIDSSNKLVIGANIKYDSKILLRNTDILLSNVYDVLTMEKLLYQGIG